MAIATLAVCPPPLPAVAAETRRGRPRACDIPRREVRALVVSELVAAGSAIEALARQYGVSGRTVKRWAALGRRLGA